MMLDFLNNVIYNRAIKVRRETNMKNTILITTVIALAMMLSGCGAPAPTSPVPIPPASATPQPTGTAVLWFTNGGNVNSPVDIYLDGAKTATCTTGLNAASVGVQITSGVTHTVTAIVFTTGTVTFNQTAIWQANQNYNYTVN